MQPRSKRKSFDALGILTAIRELPDMDLLFLYRCATSFPLTNVPIELVHIYSHVLYHYLLMCVLV